jgi:hypothetical protein
VLAKLNLASVARAVWSLGHGHGAGGAALGWLGVALAGTSAAFAIRMVVGRHDPLIHDMQYLAIFAQPNSAALRRAQEAPQEALALAQPASRLDYAPTGSFEKSAHGGQSQPMKAQTSTYEILSATERAAWLRRGFDIVEAKKGQLVPGVGKIVAIEWRAGAWRLVIENDRPASREAASPTGAAGSLNKRLIFGDGR